MPPPKLEERKVRLETADGSFVHEGIIVPFVKRPDVILWGTRVFRHVTDSIYREAFFYALVDDAGIEQLIEMAKGK